MAARRSPWIFALIMLALWSTAFAWTASGTVSIGMNSRQVVSAFGEPSGKGRCASETWWFYGESRVTFSRSTQLVTKFEPEWGRPKSNVSLPPRPAPQAQAQAEAEDVIIGYRSGGEGQCIHRTIGCSKAYLPVRASDRLHLRRCSRCW
jgi:hypothetical protein